MDLEALRTSLDQACPPAGLDAALEALWRAARGEWDAAHDLAQSVEDPTGAHVHAYLHRVEGDLANADYWYRRAGVEACRAPLEEEWGSIASALLERAEPQ